MTWWNRKPCHTFSGLIHLSHRTKSKLTKNAGTYSHKNLHALFFITTSSYCRSENLFFYNTRTSAVLYYICIMKNSHVWFRFTSHLSIILFRGVRIHIFWLHPSWVHSDAHHHLVTCPLNRRNIFLSSQNVVGAGFMSFHLRSFVSSRTLECTTEIEMWTIK